MEIDLTKYDFLKVFDKKEAEELFYTYSSKSGYDYRYRPFYKYECNDNQKKKLDKIKSCPIKPLYNFKVLGTDTRFYRTKAKNVKEALNILELEYPEFKLNDVVNIINLDDEANTNPFKELEEYATLYILYSEEECNKLENKILKNIDTWKKYNHIYPILEVKKYKKLHNQLLQMKARIIQRKR